MKVLAAVIGCLLSGISGLRADAEVAEPKPILLPTPKQVAWLGGQVSFATQRKISPQIVNAAGDLAAVKTGIEQLNQRIRALGGAGIPSVSDADAAKGDGTILWVGTQHDLAKHPIWVGPGFQLPAEASVPDGYVLKCANSGRRDVVVCAGYDARGCYYGLQTLGQLTRGKNGKWAIPRVHITDWPTYKLRLVKNAGSTDKPANIALWVDRLPRYKMNVFGSHFTGGKSSGSWRKPSQAFETNTRTIARAGKTTDTFDPMLYFGPFGENRGSLLEPKLVDDYIGILRRWIAEGYKSVVVDFNDWGIYDRLSAEERARFKDIGEVMTWLTLKVHHAIRKSHPEAEILAVPGWPHYAGLPQPDLISFCKNIPDDIMVMTTGYRTRSAKITAKWLKDWTAATGRKPFLWDNTLYSHLDQYRELVSGCYNFDAYQVEFPLDMPELLAGPGIHLNGYASRVREPGVLTFLDYVWNPEAYDAKRSLWNAQILLWGKDAPAAAHDAHQQTIAFYDFLFNVRGGKRTGTKAEALAKFAEVRKALNRLADIIGDPVVTGEIEKQCHDKAMTTLKKVFPDNPQGRRSGEWPVYDRKMGDRKIPTNAYWAGRLMARK